ncbi:protein FAM92A-A isoform X2 [Homalodisca vitripennis]|uniref:protein FAM92A-A isoform X2 n=1 Tax=Homalodisca vitripennis TaxID=197043 RepID=UPI001EEC3804|nr:protein FAM92A-A isoform X2 [Homalodisca vitripennis]
MHSESDALWILASAASVTECVVGESLLGSAHRLQQPMFTVDTTTIICCVDHRPMFSQLQPYVVLPLSKITKGFLSECDSEQQAKLVQERVLSVEANIAELCSSFSLFSRKAARLRDANDEIANVVASIAEREEVNKSMKTGLNELARKLNLIGDFRDQGVELLDKRVVEVFAGYDGICRRAKDELKVIFTARDKELSRQRQLDRLRERNPHNRHQISKAETELIKAKSEVSRNQKALEEQIDLFEKKKLKDIKAALLDFIKIELALHAKAVELYTQAYNSMSEVDEEQDLEELRNAMASDLSRLDTVKRTSFRSSSLQSIANIFTTPQKFQRHEGLPTTSMDELAEQENPHRFIHIHQHNVQDIPNSLPYLHSSGESHPMPEQSFLMSYQQVSRIVYQQL